MSKKTEEVISTYLTCLQRRNSYSLTAVGITVLGSVANFESMLVRSGVKLLKYYLDISKAEQTRRLKDRKTDPLKQWKISPIDCSGD